MAKKAKRVEKFKFMTYAEDIPNLPNLPNHGTVDKGGRILRVRADFKSVNDLMESLIEYYMAYDLLRKKIWPTLKKHYGYQDMILNSPVKVSLLFEKAYENGAGYIEHVHKSLGKMNNVLQFPNFTSYVDFLDNQMYGDEFSPTDFKVFSKVEQMYNIGYIETNFLFEILLYWEIQTAMRDTLLGWIKTAKKTPAYTGKEGPVRTASKRRHIAKQRTISVDKTDEKAEPTLTSDNNDAVTDNSIQRGDVYRIRFESKEVLSRSKTAWDYMMPLLRNPGQSFNPLELQQRVNAPPSNRLMSAAAVDMMTGDNDEEFELRQTKTGQTANMSKLHEQSFTSLLGIKSSLKDSIEKAQADGRENDMNNYEDQLEVVQKVIRDCKANKRKDPAEIDPAYSKSYDLIKKHHKSIMNALKTKHPSLYRHFGLYLKVGTICLYYPEPRIYWTVE